MVKKFVVFVFVLSMIISCENIETGASLDKETIGLIKDLGLLDNDEKVVKYYSNHSKDKAGNFFTNKRIAHYWLEGNADTKTVVSFAFYTDIRKMDTTFEVDGFDIPYMTVWREDSTNFRVFVDGSEKEKRDFFNEAIALWKKHK